MIKSRSALFSTSLLSLLACVSLLPFAWLVCAAFKRDEDAFAYLFLPWPHLHKLTLGNFSTLFHTRYFASWLLNSLFLSSLSTLLTVFISSLAGFALAKYRFAGKSGIAVGLIALMLLPPQVMVGSLYNLMHWLGWIDSYFAILAPGSVSIFGALLFRQAMLGVPDELLDSGRIDGCSELRLWWEVALPLVKPMIAAYALMSFLASWNSFLWPQIILQDEAKYTLPIGLNNLAGLPEYQHQLGVLMAGSLISITPLLLLFFLLQKEFIAGLTTGAINK